jgi:pimeloyl-ACP methyl ester carboxylesterase
MPTSKALDLEGVNIHYVDFGGHGPTIVLVHGLGGAHTNWIAVGDRLTRHGHVLALDLPGFGLSGRVPGGNTVEGMGASLARFLDAVSPEPVHLVGNSMGGTLTVLERHARPGRIASALLVCPALPGPALPRLDRRWITTLLIAMAPGGARLMKRYAERVGPEGQMRDTIALCCAEGDRVTADVRAALVALNRERAGIAWGPQTFCEATRSLMGLLVSRTRIGAALRTLAPPMLIVQGQRDRLVDPRAARMVVAANPHLELTEVAEFGHMPQLDFPEKFVEIAGGWFGRGARNVPEPAPAVA